MAGKVQIIGRVAVKVVPDVTHFRNDLRDDLKKIEKSARKLNIRATFDDTGLRTEVLKSIRDINRDIKNKDVYKIKLGADVSKIDITPKLDNEELKKIQRKLERWRDRISPLEVEVRPSMMTGASTYVTSRLEFLTRPRVVPIIPVVQGAALRKAGAAIAALSGARVLNEALDGLWDRLKRLDKMVPIIGGLAEAIAGLAGYALAGSSNLFSLSASLAQIGGAGLALPGILGGIVIGFGATFAVMKDFNKIFPDVSDKLSQLQDQMSENFWAKAEGPMRRLIDTLLPQFSAGLEHVADQLGDFFALFSTSLTGSLDGALKGMFDDLGESIRIAGEHTDAFAGIIKTLGELGAGMLPRLAGWFGNISEDFNSWLNEAAQDGRLQGWVDGGVFALKELGRVLAGMGSTLAGFARAASAAGGSTLTTFADTLEHVAEVVNGPTFQKALTGTFKAAHQAMENISNQAGPAFEAFMLRLSDTLQTILPMVGDTIGVALEAIFSALEQKGVSDGLIKMFEGIQTGIEALAPALDPMGLALGAIMQVVGALASVIGPVLGSAFTTLSEVIQTIAPPLIPIIKLLGGGLVKALDIISPLVLKVADAFAELLSGPVLNGLKTLGSALGPVLQSVVTALVPLVDPLKEILGALVTNLAPVVAAILPKLGEALVKIAELLLPVLEKFKELAEKVLPILAPVLEFLAGVILDTVVFAFTGLSEVVIGVMDVFIGVIDFFKHLFTGEWGKLWGDVKQIASGIWNIIKGAFKLFLVFGMGGLLRLGAKLLKGIWSKAWQGIRDVGSMLWSSIKGRFSSFMTSLKNAPGKALSAIKGLFKGAWNDIKAATSLLWERVPAIFRKGIDKILGWFGKLGGWILKPFKSAGSLLSGVGKTIIGGLWNGLKSGFGVIKAGLDKLTSWIPDWKGPRQRDKYLLTDAGVLIMDGLLDGMESRYDAIKKSLKGFTGDLGNTGVEGLSLRGGNFSRRIGSAIDASGAGGQVTEQKTLNYYAAPGSSLGAEEDVFAAINRTRAVGW